MHSVTTKIMISLTFKYSQLFQKSVRQSSKTSSVHSLSICPELTETPVTDTFSTFDLTEFHQGKTKVVCICEVTESFCYVIRFLFVICCLQVFGEVDNDLYEGDLLYTPVVKKWYYEVVITDIAVGGESLSLDCKKVNKKELICESHFGDNCQSAQQQELQDTYRCLSWKL